MAAKKKKKTTKKKGAKPTNPALYARVKAEAKRKFKVYPSAYANGWLVRTYKKRGGGYRIMHYTKKLDKVIKGLKKASKLHASQAKILSGINKDQKKRYKKPKKHLIPKK